MSFCNDPKCPLNRQGIPHENHKDIENKPVKNPCNDPRCAMNRMGMKHEVHDGEKITDKQNEYKIPTEKSQQKEKDMRDFHAKVKSELREKQKQFNNDQHGTDDDPDSFDDAMQELGRRIHRDNSNRLSREKILEERRKRERKTIEQEAQEEIRRREKEKTNRKSGMFSRSKSEIPSINQILHCNDPYSTFNLTQDTTCEEIKSKYKELSKNYNASRGSVNRTHEEQERLTKTQSKINIAYDYLRKKHCG